MEKSFECEKSTEINTFRDSSSHLFEQSSWQTLATFMISLQTRTVRNQIDYRTIAYSIEGDTRTVWPGIEFNGVYKLVQEHLHHLYQEGRETPAMKLFTPGDSPKSEQPSMDLADGTEFISKKTAENQVLDLQGIGQDADGEFTILPLTQPEANEISESSQEAEIEPSEMPAITEPENVMPGAVVETVEAVPERTPTVLRGKNLEAEVAEVMEPLTLEITQLKIYSSQKVQVSEDEVTKVVDQTQEGAQDEKVMVVDATRRILMGHLPPAKPFDLEVCFQLTGTGALEITQQPLPYHVEVYGKHQKTRQKFSLGQAIVGNLVDGKLTYSCRLTNVSLPEAGTYRLQVITYLENAPVAPDLLELPFVDVA